MAVLVFLPAAAGTELIAPDLGLADRLGFLVWGECSSAYVYSRQSALRLTEEWAQHAAAWIRDTAELLLPRELPET